MSLRSLDCVNRDNYYSFSKSSIMSVDPSSFGSRNQDYVDNSRASTMALEEARRWFVVLKPFKDPDIASSSAQQTPRRTRLICFPWASSNAMVYRQLAVYLSVHGIEVAALMLPGRSTRLREPLETNMDTIVGEAVHIVTSDSLESRVDCLI
jgi:hypothetical protein